MKKIFATLLALGIVFFTYSYAKAASLAIMDYPKSVNLGEQVEVGLTWKDVPLDKGYKLVLQLENWDNKADAIVALKDIPFDKSTDSKVVKVDIFSKPNLGGIYSGYRFLAAFISVEKSWEDTLTVASTKKDVSILPLLEITAYDKRVKIGDKINVTVKWRNAPSKEAYKLIVQLENWDISPGFIASETIRIFGPTEERVVSINIPSDTTTLKNCRFVAAFVSNEKEWDDTYAVASTLKDVNIE